MSRHGPLADGTLWLKLATAGALIVVAGCSDGGSPSIESAQEVATTAAAVVSTVPVSVPEVVANTIEVRLVIDGQPTSDRVAIDDLDGVDPFGRFASCSGSRAAFGAYQMLVSGSEPLGGSVQVNSTSNPHQPGRVSASARLELGSGPVDIEGSLDLAVDYRSGRFLGQTPTGSRVVIEFDCQSAQQPAPLDRTRPYVDVALLMVRDQQRRVLSMGLAAPCAETGIDVGVPDVEGTVGGLSDVLIAPDRPAPDNLRLSVGHQQIELAQSSVTATSPSAGIFSAETADGATITGAYSCRR